MCFFLAIYSLHVSMHVSMLDLRILPLIVLLLEKEEPMRRRVDIPLSSLPLSSYHTGLMGVKCPQKWSDTIHASDNNTNKQIQYKKKQKKKRSI
jgi:hypothetical protein